MMIKESIEALRHLGDPRYTGRGCNSLRDCEQQLSRLWANVRLLSDAEWSEIRSNVDSDVACGLLIYSGRMAVLAVRTRDPNRVRDAAMALVVDKDILECRDVLTVATLYYDAALRIGVDPEATLRAALQYATPARRQLLTDYLGAPAFTKSIESNGYEAVETDEGFDYRIKPD